MRMLVRSSALGKCHNKGAALIVTVLVTAMLATIVVAGVTVSLSDQRSAAAATDLSLAKSAVAEAIGEYEEHLASDPYYHLRYVDANERSRICATDLSVIAAGEAWPARCGTAWTYQNPSPTTPTTLVPMTRVDVKLEVTAPSARQSELTVVAVAKAEQMTWAERHEYTQAGTASWTLFSETSLNLDEVYGSGPLTAIAAYSGGNISGTGQVDNSVLAGEDGVAVNGTGNRLYSAAPITQDQPDGSQTTDSDNIRTLVPAERKLSSAQATAETTATIMCGIDHSYSNGLGADSATPGYIEPVNFSTTSSKVCLIQGQKLVNPGGTLTCIPKSGVCGTSTLTRYLVRPFTSGGATFLKVDGSTKQSTAPTSGDLYGAASTAEISNGSHPAAMSFWDVDLGVVRAPESGIVVTDKDVQIGMCVSAAAAVATFVSASGCETTFTAVDTVADPDVSYGAVAAGTDVNLTVMAGWTSNPRNIWFGGRIGGSGSVNLIGSNSVIVPYWAKTSGDDVTIPGAVMALGVGTPIAATRISGWPAATTDSGTLTISGGAAAPTITFTGQPLFSGYQVSTLGVMPAGWPSFDNVWHQQDWVAASAADVCGLGDPQCDAWLGVG